MKFTYRWKLSDLPKVKKNKKTVFSCFSCGGGSSMGYKMSGFDVIGCNDIDPHMMNMYKKNHNPKYLFLESIKTFIEKKDLPKELFNLDILDGSPPCSSFSMSGFREKQWGKKKKFREGQSVQILDDLFFDYIKLAEKLKPKIIIAENVKGMLAGNAKGYIKEIINQFKTIGYDVQLFLLNGASMGLPQKRERVFFICRKTELNFPDLKLQFNEKQIPVKVAFKGCKKDGKDFSKSINLKYWKLCKPGRSFSENHPKKSLFNLKKLHPDIPSFTLTASGDIFHWAVPRLISKEEACVISSFPLDYQFEPENQAIYTMGMSVPPLMMHKISSEIYNQWLNS